MVDQPPVAPRKKPSPREVNALFNERLEISIKEQGALGAIADHQSDSSRGGGLERVILELHGALRAAQQAQDSEANVDGLRNHAGQHAHQAWLLLTGSIPERISGRCDCAL